jgi:hypothetical protein
MLARVGRRIVWRHTEGVDRDRDRPARVLAVAEALQGVTRASGPRRLHSRRAIGPRRARDLAYALLVCFRPTNAKLSCGAQPASQEDAELAMYSPANHKLASKAPSAAATRYAEGRERYVKTA